jgi:hypothetical protein
VPCKGLVSKVQTPPNRSPGAFPPLVPAGATVPATRRGPYGLGCVLGGDPLVPVLLHRIFLIRRPDIRPESHRLGLRCAAPDDYSQRFSLGNDEWKPAHGSLLTRGNERVSSRGCTVRAAPGAAASQCMIGTSLYPAGSACRSDAGRKTYAVSSGHGGLQRIKPGAHLAYVPRRRRLSSS